MNDIIRSTKSDNLIAVALRIAPELASRASKHDEEGSFVHDNYQLLKKHGVMSALVPAELGGGGASIAELCEFLRIIGKACASTALALSMHQHLVAATVWKWNSSGGGEPLLRRVVNEQLVLLSTGATDWVNSNGSMRKVEGGYRVTARKVFGSGGPGADVMLTSAPYDDPEHGPQVLHFPVPLSAEGVRSLGDWNTLGMRGTGSNTLLLEDVFVPDEAIALRRPRDRWHVAWTVACAVALPILMSPYVGLAEKALAIASDTARKKPNDPHLPYVMGELECHVTTAQLAWRGMIDNAAEYEFEPVVETANRAIIGKTLCTRACVAAVGKALEASGGRGFFRGFELERIVRDVQAAPYHPLPEKKQQLFSGRLAMGLDPVTGESRAQAG